MSVFRPSRQASRSCYYLLTVCWPKTSRRQQSPRGSESLETVKKEFESARDAYVKAA